jgi:hypothetical protein
MYSMAQKVYHLYLCIRPFFHPRNISRVRAPSLYHCFLHLQARGGMIDDPSYAKSVPLGTWYKLKILYRFRIKFKAGVKVAQTILLTASP